MVNNMKASDFCSTGIYYPNVESTIKKFFSKIRDQVEYSLANCTVAVFTIANIKGLPYPCSAIVNANKSHSYVANGWKAIPYTDGMVLKENDIIEWACNHVAWYKGNDVVYASWWTDYNGTSKTNREMKLTKTIKETVDYFFKNYQFRFFHETTFSDECNRGAKGTKPSYILRYMIDLPKSVERNENVNQLQVGKIALNVRESASTKSSSFGTIGEGYYNVTNISKQSDYVWYQLGTYWVAGVKETTYLPMKEATDYKALYEETIIKLTIAEDKLNKIKEILE